MIDDRQSPRQKHQDEDKDGSNVSDCNNVAQVTQSIFNILDVFIAQFTDRSSMAGFQQSLLSLISDRQTDRQTDRDLGGSRPVKAGSP